MSTGFRRLIATLIFATAVVPAVRAGAAENLLDKAREAMREAAETIEDAARDAGRNASDFLADNPELNRDLIDLGKRIGLPGFEQAPPHAGPALLVEPPSAPAGATVTVTASGLPGVAPVRLSLGPTGDETLLATPTTSERGTLSESLRLPDWVPPGTELIFSVETEDGRLRLRSARFLVQADGPQPGETVTVTGTLSNEGVECQALRGDDGRLYTLAEPAAGGFGPGDRVTVAGVVAVMSGCMQGITITNATISAAG
jgi:hypothetical protein